MSEQITFPQMIDLAFGSPEHGIMNIRYLYALMHALVARLDLNNVRLELKGGQFCNADHLINELCEKPFIEVAEYHAIRNEMSGKYEKTSPFSQQDTLVDTIVVLRDAQERPTVSETAAILLDEDMNLKPARPGEEALMNVGGGGDGCCSDECLERLDSVERCLQEMMDRIDRKFRSDDECEDGQIYSDTSAQTCDSTPKWSTVSKPIQAPVSPPELDERVMNCIGQINEELDTIKRDLCKTQKCVSNVCEKSKVLGATTEEADVKFDEVMKLFDDYDKRINENKVNICMAEKQLDRNTNRIETAFEELDTLFSCKAEKDEMESLLARKANRCELDFKVDLEMFNFVKCELSEAIVDSNKRIKLLTNDMDRNVKQIFQCLSTKMDKEIFRTFARCVEDRIKEIAKETEKWMNMKKKEVCPFTRTPFIQNLCCGACNQSVVMKGQECNVPLMPSMSNITWNCSTKALCCRTGGKHTITTAQDRCPKRSQFVTHFKGPQFANSNDCLPEKKNFDFLKQPCYKTASTCSLPECIPNVPKSNFCEEE